MPVALTTALEQPAPLVPPRKRWTREECAALEASGIWDQQKLELIDGELISKMGKNRPHVIALMRMMFLLTDVFGRDRVNLAAPIDVAAEDNPSNDPEPDLIVLRRDSGSFRMASPQPSDLALVGEIADTTLRFDLTVKARLYARAGIVDYWVLDLNARRLIVHREPEGDGYRSVVAYSEAEKVAALGAAEAELLVGEMFGG